MRLLYPVRRAIVAIARTVVERFAAHPAHWRSGERASGIGEDGRALWVEKQPVRNGARCTLVLAPATGKTP